MRSLMLVVCAAALLLPLRATAQTHDAVDSPRVILTVSNPIQIGQTLLAPGAYRFQCRHIDGKTFLVVQTESGKELVRVPCQQEILPSKIESSELRSTVREDGVRALQSVRIKGESIAHRLVE